MYPRSGLRQALLATTVLVAATLAACAPDPGPRAPLSTPQDFTVARSIDSAADPAAAASQVWWKDYDDPQLAALIEEGLAGNPDLAAAGARMREAEAQAQKAGAALMPAVATQGSVNAVRQNFDLDNLPPDIKSALPHAWTSQGGVSAQVGYQIDFFGRNHAALAAATSEARAAQMEQAAARLQISTGIALAYAEVVRLEGDKRAAVETVALREATARLVHQRVDRGLETKALSAQADSESASAQADLAVVGGELTRARHVLAALLGKGPDRGLEIAVPRDKLLARHVLPASASLDLLGRRPDIVAARLRVEAAAKRIDVAHADFYPNVNLLALAGFQTLGLQSLGGGSVTFGQVGPAVSLPIFSGGRLEGAYRGAEADYDQAVAAYNQTLTLAIRDVASAVSDRKALETQHAQMARALAEVETSHRLISMRYESGLATYIDVLTIENALVARRQALTDLETHAFALDVALVRALGGGFVHT